MQLCLLLSLFSFPAWFAYMTQVENEEHNHILDPQH